MDTLIPEADEEDSVKTLIPENDETGVVPQQSAPRSRTRKPVSDATYQRIQAFINAPSRKKTVEEPEQAPKNIGITGTIKEGAKSTARALGAAADTYQGDEEEVIAASKAQQAAEKDPRLADFLSAVEDHKKRLGPDPSLWESIKAVGSAALDNPAGAGLMVAEQIPNSAVALGSAGAGALAGSVAGPVGSIVGGIGGLAFANVALETGHGAIQAAADETFTPEEQSQVKSEGAIKGGVITGVDALTLGATKFITGASRRAVERATTKTLADKGVDVGNAAAVKSAMADPAVMAAVNESRKLAAEASSKLGKRIAQTGGALALETIGEGVGEYVGEFAATGEANAVDAVVESLAGLSQSMGEVAFTSALNKRAMARLFDSEKAAEEVAKKDTENTGVEHEVQPHPVEPEKFVAVPKTRTAQGVELEQDEQGNIRPKAPEESPGLNEIRTQRAEGRAGFERSAEDNLLLAEKRRKNAEAYARNPIILPGVDDAPATDNNAPTINGRPVTALSSGILTYSANYGSTRAKKVAQDELARRKTEGIDLTIANAELTPSETVDHILKTGAEKAQESAKPVAISKPIAAPKKTTTAIKTPKAVKPEATKAPKAPGVIPEPDQNKNTDIRPLIESLIKRRAAARQIGKERSFDTALNAAKSMLAGETISPAKFKKAAALLKNDKASVDILNALQAKASETKQASKPKTELRSANTTPLVLPDGTNLDAQWDVVDADSVTASLKEGVNQPRDRSRAASDIQVQGIANNPDYRRLSDSPVMDVGAPTLSHDGLIVGGNGRFEGVSRAYDQGSGKNYLAQLKADAEAKGIDPAKIATMKKPVLVRRITKPFDTRKLAVASNSGTGLQYSAMEMAKIDAGRMKGLADLEVTDNGDIALTGSNRQSIRYALGDYNAAELGAIVDKDGALSQEGVRRIRNAMLYAAYGSNPTLERLVESSDNDLRNISGALVKAAGSAAKVRADIEAGAIPSELDISTALVNAVEELSKLRAQGMTVDEHLAQIGMFGESMTEDEKRILRVLGANIRSQKKVAEFIRGYYDAVSRIDLTSGDMFGAKTPSKSELLENAKERITDRPPEIKSLFSRSTSAINPERAKQPRDNESASGRSQKDRVKSVANSIRKGWKNAPEVVVLNSMEDAPESVKAENNRQLSQGATGEPEGFVSEGKVYLVASQLRTPEDVTRVLLHETLGHFGLQGTFGPELQKILKQVSALRRRDVEAKAKQYGLDANKQSDRFIAAEEVLAELAQNNPQNTFVQRAIAAIRTWLRNNIPGFENLSLSDSEIIEDILIPARQFVQQGNAAATNKAVLFSRAATMGPTPAAIPFREKIDKAVDSLIYNFQDRFKPLKDIQKRSGPVDEDADAALAEERYSGMVRARTDAFEEQRRDPLLKAIHDSGVAYEDVEEYLHALHAPSRNKAMREINPTEAELKSQTDALEKQRDSLSNDADVTQYLKRRRDLRDAEADIEDGIADESLASMIKQDLSRLKRLPNVSGYVDALEKLKALRLVKPFKGDNTALSGMSDAESRAILAKIDANGTRRALDAISAIVDDITSATRQIYVDSGLEKADTIEAWNNKYEHYIPLHRDEVSGNTMPRIGQGFNIRGKESKRATGSTKEVTNILAHVVAQHEAAIIRSEKAAVDRALFRFAQLHPDPSLWTLDDAPTLRAVDQTSGLVVERVDPAYKNRPEVLTLKIDGDEHTITFNEQNQEAMRLAASMKNMNSQEMGEVTQMVGRFTRFLATMNTTANPVFTARNFLRDLQTAYVNLSDTAIADKKREVFRDIPAAIKGMWDLSRGKHNSQWAKHAEEFKAAGGQTGWMAHYKDIGHRADTLKKELERMGPGKWNFTRRQARAWWDVVQDANNAVENAARLAAYVNARKSGLSAGKAASLAKNLTVNFNARGAKSVELNAWYMFMNASVQGTARLAKALSNRQVQKIVAGVVLSGFLMDMLARSMAGDDDEDGENDYDQLPEHTKAMNFVFMVDNNPVTIPMPYGYNFFASAGRKISEMMFRENYSAVKSATDLAAVFLDAFNPTGQAGSMLQYAAPTVADPFVQWSENKNFAGNPMRRAQNPFGVPKPEYQMGFKSTSAPAKWLAEKLNNETGGNEVRPGFIDVNPVFFDFAVSSIAGGAGRTYLQATSGPMKIASGDELKTREIPFVNIFFSARPEYQTERKYFEAVRSVELANKELKNYREQRNLEMVRQIRAEYGQELRLIESAKETKKVLDRLRDRETIIIKNDPPNKRELKKQLEDRKREIMSRFNKQYARAVAAE